MDKMDIIKTHINKTYMYELYICNALNSMSTKLYLKQYIGWPKCRSYGNILPY